MHIDEELFKKKEFRRNLKLYEDAMMSGKTVFMDIDDLTDIIDYYNYDGQVDEAERVADYALSLYPGAIGPLVFKARKAVSDGDIEEAGFYCEAIEDKSDIDYFYLSVELKIADAKYDEAEELLEQAFPNIDSEDKENFILDTAALYVDYGISDLGEKWLNMMDNKENNERLELISRIYCNKGDYEEATRVLEKLIDNNPFICRYWNMLAMIQLCCNQFEECLNSAEYSLAITPDNADGLWCKAKSLLGLSNAEKAMIVYDKFLERVPNCARAEADKGSCYLHMGEYKEAIEMLKLAESHSENDNSLLAQIYDDMAFAYSNIKDVGKALSYLDKADKQNPFRDTIVATDYQRMVLKGHILLQNGQREDAIEIFEKAVEKSKHNPEVIYKVIASAYDNALYELAIKYFKILEKNMPEGWTLGYSYMAACLIKTSKIKEGISYLKKASKINPYELEMLFGDMFPPEITREQYYDFLKKIKVE